MYKLFLLLWLIFAGAPALGYVKYLHDEEENKAGAAAVFLIVAATAVAVFMARGE